MIKNVESSPLSVSVFLKTGNTYIRKNIPKTENENHLRKSNESNTILIDFGKAKNPLDFRPDSATLSIFE